LSGFSTTASALLLNRALAANQCGRHADAVAACTEALALAPGSVKALFRRGQAHVRMGDVADAQRDLLKAQQLDNRTYAAVVPQALPIKRSSDPARVTPAAPAKPSCWMMRCAVGNALGACEGYAV
jgi:tetratricopeptide (TPR) repeat protein